jgi:alkanesulfonate monooxygenase SsuD/methylene tetrahydromethanopterin reductase-like flavin-dependent oxidoreductase (luciferase family)
MKFGLVYNTGYYGTDPDQLIAAARHAEACGFESFYVTEHIALYPGAAVGPVTIPASMPIADPLECLSFVAAATERILLGTAVLLVPYHHPVILAKRLATLDVLSKGRMRLLTVGVGALPGEAMAAGVDFATRGRPGQLAQPASSRFRRNGMPQAQVRGEGPEIGLLRQPGQAQSVVGEQRDRHAERLLAAPVGVDPGH